ncbi:MAG TPA: SURF1 family protein [Nevskiaceae bacterium]|nr:SURF1 family protein [Nevskiaceae bacterium]
MVISTDGVPPAARRHSAARHIVLALVGTAVFALFIALGTWQVQRYHYKLTLAAQVAQRAHAPPVAPPGPAAWPTVSAQRDQYLRVQLVGHFLPDQETFVHGTSELGYGFWAMAPFATQQGFIVLVNRGYVPADNHGAPRPTRPPSTGLENLAGLVRMSEPGGGFLRPNRPAQGLWYSRDVAAIGAAQRLPAGRVAPYFVDAEAGNSKQWPRAGLTVLHFYNESNLYAITWYLLAIFTLVCAWIVIRHERQRPD